MRLILTVADSKGITRELASQVFSSLHKIGCRCMLDKFNARSFISEAGQVVCSNRFEPPSIEGSIQLDNDDNGSSLCINNVREG